MLIKTELRKLLRKTGVWYPFNQLRSMSQLFRWLRSGCSGVAPHSVKMMAVRSYLKRFAIQSFVETGTYLGETLGYIAQTGISCVSIELSQELHDAARKRFADCRNVTLISGDSGHRLPELLRSIHEPTLFWLDGHYSSGITAGAEAETPISTELRAILSHPVKRHAILVDDARCFNGTKNYPHLDELLRVIKEEGNYKAEVSIDIIRITPV